MHLCRSLYLSDYCKKNISESPIARMANRTVKDAMTVKGTNPQYLVEKIIRSTLDLVYIHSSLKLGTYCTTCKMDILSQGYVFWAARKIPAILNSSLFLWIFLRSFELHKGILTRVLSLSSFPFPFFMKSSFKLFPVFQFGQKLGNLGGMARIYTPVLSWKVLSRFLRTNFTVVCL